MSQWGSDKYSQWSDSGPIKIMSRKDITIETLNAEGNFANVDLLQWDAVIFAFLAGWVEMFEHFVLYFHQFLKLTWPSAKEMFFVPRPHLWLPLQIPSGCWKCWSWCSRWSYFFLLGLIILIILMVMMLMIRHLSHANADDHRDRKGRLDINLHVIINQTMQGWWYEHRPTELLQMV